MRLVVLGANGRTGVHVLRRALQEGADVTAVVRSEVKRPAFSHDRLRVAVGDPCDPRVLAGVFRDHDAVVSTLGGRRPSKRATSVYPLSAEAIAEAAWNTGLKKVVVTSSALLFPPRRWIDGALAALVGNVVRSATRMEEILRATDLDVTIARCGFLTDAQEDRYRALKDALPAEGSTVSRQSLARFLVDCATGSEAGRQVYGVSGPVRA